MAEFKYICARIGAFRSVAGDRRIATGICSALKNHSHACEFGSDDEAAHAEAFQIARHEGLIAVTPADLVHDQTYLTHRLGFDVVANAHQHLSTWRERQKTLTTEHPKMPGDEYLHAAPLADAVNDLLVMVGDLQADLDALKLTWHAAEDEVTRLRADLANGTASDGYHTFAELYDHRITLFLALCFWIHGAKSSSGDPVTTWKSKLHSDGSAIDGWFVMGIGKEAGEQITYHLPLSRWDEAVMAEVLERAPEFDGHTSADVLVRLRDAYEG